MEETSTTRKERVQRGIYSSGEMTVPSLLWTTTSSGPSSSSLPPSDAGERGCATELAGNEEGGGVLTLCRGGLNGILSFFATSAGVGIGVGSGEIDLLPLDLVLLGLASPAPPSGELKSAEETGRRAELRVLRAPFEGEGFVGGGVGRGGSAPLRAKAGAAQGRGGVA